MRHNGGNMDILPDATGTGTLRRRAISVRAEMPCLPCAVPSERAPPTAQLTTSPPCSGNISPGLMEVASLQHLGDSFSCGWLNRGAPAAAPSFERLADADLGHSFGSSTRSSFIDMDPADLFSMRWTTTAVSTPPESEFEFGLPGGGGSSDPPSPVLVSASKIIRDGRLLPSDPVCRSGAQEQHGELNRVADMPGAPRSPPSSPLFHSAQSTPASLSSCSSGRSAAAAGRPRRGQASPSSWKILLQYLRFLVPLYRKVRALRRLSAARQRVAPASPARASTSSSSMEWCHGNADTAVRDAILYCKKSSGQDA
ncbi:unnamed protein product [Urochloa decumbens]|uniref:Membrane-associated kinase regulator 6 n=1 Tax=Urochloa decumbens TaxID=240449 RepID=A0ABC8WM02_9POAL